MRIAMIGTRGVPARYGGFETAVEEVGARLAERGHDVTVYCRNPGQRLPEHRGMRLVNLPALRVRAGETLSHAAASAAHAVVRGRPDVALVFNAANAPVVPALQRSGIPVAVHVDGLEWERAKWAGTGARYYRWAARRSAMWADEVIVDSRAVGEVVHRLFGRDGTFLPYGAPLLHPEHDRLAAVGLAARNYHLVVARIEPENHVVEIVQGYRSSAATHPLVVVGDTPYSDAYAQRVRRAAADDERIRLLGSVWDQHLLDQLYGSATSYLHGHSVGGTNPSLLRAMGAGAPVTVFDCPFNAEVVAGHARLFATPRGVTDAVEADELQPAAARARGLAGQERVAVTYRWDDVADGYEDLVRRLGAGATERRAAAWPPRRRG